MLREIISYFLECLTKGFFCQRHIFDSLNCVQRLALRLLAPSLLRVLQMMAQLRPDRLEIRNRINCYDCLPAVKHLNRGGSRFTSTANASNRAELYFDHFEHHREK